MLNSVRLVGVIICWLGVTSFAFGQGYELPPLGKRLIGLPIAHKVEQGDYFQAIAEKYNVGFLALMAANPTIDPFLPETGTELTIPSQLLLPYVQRQGIVINLPELRLYYFLPEQNIVHVFPVGIGQQGLETPRTTSVVGEKRKNPVWRPTLAMKERYFLEHQVALADEVPAGPNNPFGQYALRIGTSEYLIHGSNQRFGIGMRASSGCIRLYDDDIQWLYEHVPIGTLIKIIDQPIKMSYEAPDLKLLEIHQPLTVEGVANHDILADTQLNQFIAEFEEIADTLQQEMKRPSGLVLQLAK